MWFNISSQCSMYQQFRRLLASGNRDVTIFREREKRALAGQRKRRCPIWRKPHEALSRQIERKHRCSIAAVEMQIKERETKCAIKQKTCSGSGSRAKFQTLLQIPQDR